MSKINLQIQKTKTSFGRGREQVEKNRTSGGLVMSYFLIRWELCLNKSVHSKNLSHEDLLLYTFKMYVYFLHYIFILFMSAGGSASSLIPTCGSQELNPGHQTRQKAHYLQTYFPPKTGFHLSVLALSPLCSQGLL